MHKGQDEPEKNEQILGLYAQVEELKLQLENYKWQMEEIEKQQQEIRTLHQNSRKLKHDMRNHLMVIASYLGNGQTEEAKDYTSQILDRLNRVQSYVETGNAVVNHILNEKLQYARENGIDVKAQIDQVAFETIGGVDLSALLANLLDNAMEASLKERNRELRIKIYRKKGYEGISVKNRISQSVLAQNPELITTKQDSSAHGFGVGRIREIAEQYHGMYEFYEEDGYFCVNVFIPQ